MNTIPINAKEVFLGESEIQLFNLRKHSYSVIGDKLVVISNSESDRTSPQNIVLEKHDDPYSYEYSSLTDELDVKIDDIKSELEALEIESGWKTSRKNYLELSERARELTVELNQYEKQRAEIISSQQAEFNMWRDYHDIDELDMDTYEEQIREIKNKKEAKPIITRYKNTDFILPRDNTVVCYDECLYTEEQIIEKAIQDGYPIIIKNGHWYLKGKNTPIQSIKRTVFENTGRYSGRVYCLFLEYPK